MAAAQAQTFEIGAMGSLVRTKQTPLGSLDVTGGEDDDTSIRARNGLGARFTWNTPGYYGHEFGFSRTRATLRTRTREDRTVIEHQAPVYIYGVTYNFLMYFMPSGERVRPYVTGGLQMFQYAEPNIEVWAYGKSRNYGGNYGGGLKINLFKHAMLRVDAREYIGGKPYGLNFSGIGETGGLMRTREASAGFSITF
jgi:hypothetical protein